MNERISRAIILNLGDGLTTSLSYLLPMVLFNGHFQGRSLLIGGTGGAVSMALNLDDAENGMGSSLETIVAFTSAFLGGILPVLPFILLRGIVAGFVCGFIVATVMMVLIYVKSLTVGVPTAFRQTLKSLLPAMVIVALLSLLV